MENSLTSAGYTVTYVKDGDVTVNFLTTQLNNYRVIIWRTDAYEHAHTVYWYLGQQVSQALRQAYASDLSSGELDSSDGVMGADVKFFNDSFNAGMLSNVRLLIIVSSMSSMLAPCFITAGVQSIIDFSNTIDMQFNWVDYLTTGIVRLLAEGYSVADAVSDVITPLLTMRLEDPLDAMEIPSVSYSGNYALTIT